MTLEINGVRVHEKVTAEAVTELVERYRGSLDNPGMCILCGAEAEGVEPDAEHLDCEACEGPGVYGAEELLIYLVV